MQSSRNQCANRESEFQDEIWYELINNFEFCFLLKVFFNDLEIWSLKKNWM